MVERWKNEEPHYGWYSRCAACLEGYSIYSDTKGNTHCVTLACKSKEQLPDDYNWKDAVLVSEYPLAEHVKSVRYSQMANSYLVGGIE